MRRITLFFILLALIASLTIIVIAQDDDDNLCFDGTWYCPDPSNSRRCENGGEIAQNRLLFSKIFDYPVCSEA
jgi:hypothetical protein